MNRERQGFHISHVYSLGQDFLHHTIIFDLVAFILNCESHTLNVAIHILLPLGELLCLLTNLVLHTLPDILDEKGVIVKGAVAKPKSSC